MKPFHVYLLTCADGSYYCGQTDNIEARMQQHYAGEIGYTSTRKPVELVWQGEFETRVGALEFEQRIKGWSRAKKEALIRGDWERIKELAKTKSKPTPACAPSPCPESVERPSRALNEVLRPFDRLRAGGETVGRRDG